MIHIHDLVYPVIFAFIIRRTEHPELGKQCVGVDIVFLGKGLHFGIVTNNLEEK